MIRPMLEVCMYEGTNSGLDSCLPAPQQAIKLVTYLRGVFPSAICCGLTESWQNTEQAETTLHISA